MEPTKLFDLDALRRPARKVRLNGAEHALGAATIATVARMGDLGKQLKAAHEAKDPEAQVKAYVGMLRLVLPSLSEDELGALEHEQAEDLLEFWNEVEAKPEAADGAEAAKLAADPTPPG